MNKTGSTTKRLTLIDRARDTIVRDPAAHARLQVKELDKAAQHAESKKKQCNDDVEKNLKEIQNIDNQIAMLMERYKPLCQHIDETKAKRLHLIETLNSCLSEERKIMGSIKSTAHDRTMDDFKLNRQTATMVLKVEKGFDCGPNTTYYQHKKMSHN